MLTATILEDLVIFLAYLRSELWLNSKGSLIENYGIRSWPGFNLAPRERRLTRDCGKKIMWFHIGLAAALLKINTIFFYLRFIFLFHFFFFFFYLWNYWFVLILDLFFYLSLFYFSYFWNLNVIKNIKGRFF